MENETVSTETVQTTEQPPEATAQEAESPPVKTTEPAPQSDEDHVRKRIDKIVWQREEARREAEYWRNKAAQPTKPEAETADPTKPNVNDPKFKSYDEYTEALTEWKVEQRIQKARDEFNHRSQKERMSETIQTFNERAEVVREKFPDYDELFERAVISEAMAPAIMDSEQGPELVVYLSKNPDVARKIYRLSPMQAAREIGKIEANLDNLLQTKTVTNAKPPLRPVKPSGEVPDGLDDKLDIKEWTKRRNKQLGR